MHYCPPPEMRRLSDGRIPCAATLDYCAIDITTQLITVLGLSFLYLSLSLLFSFIPYYYAHLFWFVEFLLNICVCHMVSYAVEKH